MESPLGEATSPGCLLAPRPSAPAVLMAGGDTSLCPAQLSSSG